MARVEQHTSAGRQQGGTGAEGLEPADPRDLGIDDAPVTQEQVEPMHILANEHRAELREAGFDGRPPRAMTTSETAWRVALGASITTKDGDDFEVGDLVIDPDQQRITHLVVQPRHRHDRSRLVAIGEVAAGHDGLTISRTSRWLDHTPAIEEIGHFRIGDWPDLGEGWRVGVVNTWAMPFYGSVGWSKVGDGLDLDLGAEASVFDRIPEATEEIRRASEIRSSDDHRVGHVAGALIGRDGRMSHIIGLRDHLWGDREVAIPIADVARIHTDQIDLRASRHDVDRYPSVRRPHHR